MVRRRDPGWGETDAVAQQAEIDTFHYTNCTPQHKDLNRRDWAQLEDYILEAAETRDFRANVFTGPVFRPDDKTLLRQPGAEGILIPAEFWKVVVMVNADTNKLSATGYVLSHGRMLRDLTEASFVYGEYATYQVQIARIEQETGLDFGFLRESDPLGAVLDIESPFGQIARRIDGPDSITLRTGATGR
jgi:endonuclease G